MPKQAQPGQVVHGGKNFEKAARKDAAKKQKKADKEAEYAIWQEGVAHVRCIEEQLREAKVDFKTALPSAYDLTDDEESGTNYYSTEEDAEDGYPSLTQLARRASVVVEDFLYEKKHFNKQLIRRVADMVPTHNTVRS